MALFTPSESPAVVVREIDLTGGVPNVQSTTGAIAGAFRWGPVLQRVNIANEAELAATFGTPVDSDLTQPHFSRSFLAAAQFLRYSNSLVVVRNNDSDGAGNEPLNSYAVVGRNISNITSVDDSDYSVAQGSTLTSRITNGIPNSPSVGSLNFSTLTQVTNRSNFEARQSSLEGLSDNIDDAYAGEDSGGGFASAKIGFIAKYPGELGNSLKVAWIGADSDNTAFNAWTYASSFDAAPGTSYSASLQSASGDEMHLVVIDEDGKFSGTRGTVLERFSNLSILRDGKSSEGVSQYAKDVINERSNYIWFLNFDSDLSAKGAGGAVAYNTEYWSDSVVAKSVSMALGTDGGPLSVAGYDTAHDLFEDKDQVEIDFLIAPSVSAQTNLVTIVNDLVATAQSTRKDCVVVTSPSRSDLLNVTSDATKVTNTVAFANRLTSSSYLIVDNNYLKVYDKYNDRYIDIPAASTVAGIMAATDINRAAWFSPAGSARGQVLGITALNYSPTKAQRDTLYKAGVNPIANIPGQGTLLFGDKTHLLRPSAFDRINVRRLFLLLERAIGRAAEQVLFEFNDEFTRANFVNIIEPVLREVQGRRGITDFRVVCDETNNTAAVIDRNEFKADLFIKPARSINYVTLSFVAVRTGVDFEEVVGTV